MYYFPWTLLICKTDHTCSWVLSTAKFSFVYILIQKHLCLLCFCYLCNISLISLKKSKHVKRNSLTSPLWLNNDHIRFVPASHEKLLIGWNYYLEKCERFWAQRLEVILYRSVKKMSCIWNNSKVMFWEQYTSNGCKHVAYMLFVDLGNEFRTFNYWQNCKEKYVYMYIVWRFPLLVCILYICRCVYLFTMQYYVVEL